ncbi:hypothetical protein BDW22DRAFT_1354839 [Trametopsis cervina]|nr:hypothetical protein BDW22DRAFT_1354839 [Trametopsis cervina]
MSGYRPLILSSRFWLSLLALVWSIAAVAASPTPEIELEARASSSKKACHDPKGVPIKCPPTKASKLFSVIILSVVFGVVILGGLLWFCCSAATCTCALCAASCCSCCGKRKKAGGQVYQSLPEQGKNNATVIQPLYTANSMAYNPPSDAPYDPPTAPPPSAAYPEKYNTYNSSTSEHHAGEAASYYAMPELTYEYKADASSSKVSLPQAQTEAPHYQPPAYPPTQY